MFTNSSILVVVAHPDDEWWGLGGTLLRLRKKFNSNLHICIVSDGERGDGTGTKKIDDLTLLCTEKLNIECPTILCFPDCHIDRNKQKVITEIDKTVKKYSPDVIFTHFPQDFHQDHKAVYNCVMVATRVDPSISVIFMETPFKTVFSPNYYVDITDYLEDKLILWETYYSCENWRRVEYSTDYLAKMAAFRGLNAGVKYAEAFILKKGVLK